MDIIERLDRLECKTEIILKELANLMSQQMGAERSAIQLNKLSEQVANLYKEKFPYRE